MDSLISKLPTPVSVLVCRHLRANSSEAAFQTLLYLAEGSIKLIASSLWAGLYEADRPCAIEIAQRMILDSNGIGGWTQGIQSLCEETSTPLEFRPAVQWLNQVGARRPEHLEIKRGIDSILEYLQQDPLPEKKWKLFQVLDKLAVIRNKTTGHGAPLQDFYEFANEPLRKFLYCVLDEMPIFEWQWIYKHNLQRMSLRGAYPRALEFVDVDFNNSDTNGIYIVPTAAAKAFNLHQMLLVRKECQQFYFVNGFAQKVEYLDYATNDRIKEDLPSELSKADKPQENRKIDIGYAGRLSYAHGEWDRAERQHRTALKQWRKNKNFEPDQFIATLRELALLSFRKGAFEDGEAFINELIEFEQIQFGHNDVRIMRILNELATNMLACGRYDAAWTALQRSSDLWQVNRCPTTNEAARMLKNFGAYYTANGRIDDALEAYTSAKKLLVELCPAQAELLAIEANIATLMTEQGRPERALEIYHQVVSQLKDTDTEALFAIVDNIVEALVKAGHDAAAEEHLKDSLNKARGIMPLSKMLLASRHLQLGVFYRRHHRLDEAECQLSQARVILETDPVHVSAELASVYSNLSSLYESRALLEEAVNLCDASLKIKGTVLGRLHPSVGLELNNQAQLFCRLRRYSEAENLFKRAISNFKASFGVSHADLALVYENLSRLYETQQRSSEAQEALLISRNLRSE